MSSSLVSPKPVSYLDQSARYRWEPAQRGYGGTPAQQLAVQLPHSLTPGLGSHPPGIGAVLGGGGAPGREIDSLAEHFHVAEQKDKICSLVTDLMDAHTREAALLELSKKREQYDELALILWHSFGALQRRLCYLCRTHKMVAGIMPTLLQEIVSVYPLLSPPSLTAHVSNRVCNALALLQCVASHSDTRQLFLNGK